MSDDTARIDLKDCTCEWMPTTDGGQSLVQDITCPFHMKGGQRLFDAVAHIYEAMRASSASHGPTEHATRKHLDDALAALRTPGGDEGDRTEDGLCECGHGADRHKCRDCRCDSFSVPEATPAESREIEDCSECGRATLEGECPACLGDRTEDGTGALCRYCGAPESRWSFDRCSYPGPHGHRDPAPSDAAPDVPGEGDALDVPNNGLFPVIAMRFDEHEGYDRWVPYVKAWAAIDQLHTALAAREADAPEPGRTAGADGAGLADRGSTMADGGAGDQGSQPVAETFPTPSGQSVAVQGFVYQPFADSLRYGRREGVRFTTSLEDSPQTPCTLYIHATPSSEGGSGE